MVKKFKKFLKKEGSFKIRDNERRGRGTTSYRCYKCGKNDHMIKDFPEHEKEEKQEKSTRRKKGKDQVPAIYKKGRNNALLTNAWRDSSSSSSDDEKAQDKGVMAAENSQGASRKSSETQAWALMENSDSGSDSEVSFSTLK